MQLYYMILFSSVGIEADGEKVALVVKELAGKNLEEVIAAGTEKLGSVPSGGTYLLYILSASDISTATLSAQYFTVLLRWRSCSRRSCCWWCRACCRCSRRSSS